MGAIDVDSYGGGVRALALTPQGDFGDLPNLWQGFKARLETLAQVGPHSRLHRMAPTGGSSPKPKTKK
ncbi:hypothetical protein JP39_03150 [Companilactobacillus heilongjiangensis]|uniref:Uncharacterized protein n=1 Tax=Companilactobacillus heilongjiangensis TaxID=1074467 RepID=A0A0K2LB68_9LACO|nr:hypothetical protein JP39_03150 [Companilactobacillus heilongjiangensis]